MTDAQVHFHIQQMREATNWPDDDALVCAVAERMLDDTSDDEAREAARQHVRRVMLERDFNMIGG